MELGKIAAWVMGVAVVLVLGFLQCTGVQGGVSSKWIAYQAPDGSFSVLRPSNLAPGERSDPSGSFMVQFQAGSSTAATTAHFLGFNYTRTGQVFVVAESDAKGGTAQQWADFLRSNQSTKHGYEELSYTRTTILAHDAYRWVFKSDEQTTSGSNVRARTEFDFVVIGSKVFVLGSYAPSSEFDSAATSHFLESFATTEPSSV